MPTLTFSSIDIFPDDQNTPVKVVSGDELEVGLDVLGGRSPADYSVSALGFTAKPGSWIVLPLQSGRMVILVGADKQGLSPDGARIVGASIARSASELRSISLDLTDLIREVGAVAIRYVVEGIALGGYRFDKYRTNAQDLAKALKLESVRIFVGQDSEEVLAREILAGEAIASATILARDLVNEPAGFLTPTKFAELAEALVVGKSELTIEVWDLERIKSEQLGALLGVAAGSAQEPRVVVVTFTPPQGYESTVALVGKGITFDSGGLNLKSFEGMKTMKTDMGGAAAVLGCILALPFLGAKVRVIGFMMLTENMPGGTATKPGDVLLTRLGKTIEVLNTDAEGRLVLADGLTLANELAPNYIVDLATLTGACVVALGDEIAGVLGNNDELIDELSVAGETAGEPIWRLPLPERYKSHIHSEIADMKNIGNPGSAGAISGAMLLAEFVGKTKWAHIDIAGPSRASSDNGYLTKGGTGFGARLLCYFIEDLEG